MGADRPHSGSRLTAVPPAAAANLAVALLALPLLAALNRASVLSLAPVEQIVARWAVAAVVLAVALAVEGQSLADAGFRRPSLVDAGYLLVTAVLTLAVFAGTDSLVAAVFTVVYLRRRTLAPVVGTHVLVWAFSVLGQFYG